MGEIAAVVLAAGQGTRMKSKRAKVLHPVAGRPMAEYVLQALRQASVKRVLVVVGHQAEEVKQALGPEWEYVLQAEQLGTGHAVAQALPALLEAEAQVEAVLVLCGDTPLIRPTTIQLLVEAYQKAPDPPGVIVLTARVPDPKGYGRVLRSPSGELVAIREEKDLAGAPELLAINEVNTGIYCFSLPALSASISQLGRENAQGEYYLTDSIELIRQQGLRVEALVAPDYQEVLGVNSRLELARAEAILRDRVRVRLMEAGVSIMDPASTFIDDGVQIGSDTVVLPFTYIFGHTQIGRDCQIGPGTTISDSTIADGVSIQQSVLKEVEVGPGCNIGPFSYLRPGTRLDREVKVGDFVEIKNSYIGPASKVPHLSYVGDATVGARVNIGAGTITCNYDGQKKWPTVIGDDAFIGSNTNLVAPVQVGEGAVIGAGSTITKDVPPGALGIARDQQRNVPNWKKKQSKG
ncbi:MAG: bifunctional UDP-N-acetylglucosamine diphosphorylase/glucosamine-1-phosphate N-acetyltransferase GlmU [Clostridia bacterium]|nr:bifunctional UDP-N-acetylglucosamine diphosphorylase/glucosamine-1-phosphate N-acetyltransferase GlmU [Clostridia bacterium]